MAPPPPLFWVQLKNLHLVIEMFPFTVIHLDLSYRSFLAPVLAKTYRRGIFRAAFAHFFMLEQEGCIDFWLDTYLDAYCVSSENPFLSSTSLMGLHFRILMT